MAGELISKVSSEHLSIKHQCKSSIIWFHKRDWFRDQCKNRIWSTISITYLSSLQRPRRFFAAYLCFHSFLFLQFFLILLSVIVHYFAHRRISWRFNLPKLNKRINSLRSGQLSWPNSIILVFISYSTKFAVIQNHWPVVRL